MSRSSRTILSVCGVVALAASTSAQYKGPGEVEIRTKVSDVLMKPEVGQFVIIEGRLSKRLDTGVFQFTDGTAEIRVRFDPKLILGKLVTETSMVEIGGRVTESFQSTPEIEVLRLTVLSY